MQIDDDDDDDDEEDDDDDEDGDDDEDDDDWPLLGRSRSLPARDNRCSPTTDL